jgi:translation initiation factor IF-2
MTKKRVHEIAKEQGLSSKELLEKLKAAGVEAKAAASSIDETVALQALGSNGTTGNGAPAAAQLKGSTATVAPPGVAVAAKATALAGSGKSSAPAAAPASASPAGQGPVDTPTATPSNGAAVVQAGLSEASSATEPGLASQAAGGAAGERVRPTRDSRTGERTPGGVGPGGRRRVVIDSQASRRQQGGPANQPQRRPRRGRRRRGTYDDTIAPIDAAAMEATDEIRVNSGSTVKDVAEYLGVPVPEVIK